MADTAAHLVDRVFPRVPVRQWVLTVPYALRYRLAYDASLVTDVLAVFTRTVFASLIRLALCILAQPAKLEAQGKPKEMNAYGTVKSVSANTLTIAAAGGKEMSFTIDSSTKFIGKGLSTKTARLGKLTAPDAVAMNDRVTVKYTEMSGAMHAVNVRVTNKAIVAKK